MVAQPAQEAQELIAHTFRHGAFHQDHADGMSLAVNRQNHLAARRSQDTCLSLQKLAAQGLTALQFHVQTKGG